MGLRNNFFFSSCRPNTTSNLVEAPPTSSSLHRPTTSQHLHGNKSPHPLLDLPQDILSAIEHLDVTGGSRDTAGARKVKSHRDEGHRGQDEVHRGQEKNSEELLPPNIDDMGAGEWKGRKFGDLLPSLLSCPPLLFLPPLLLLPSLPPFLHFPPSLPTSSPLTLLLLTLLPLPFLLPLSPPSFTTLPPTPSGCRGFHQVSEGKVTSNARRDGQVV